MRNSDWFWDWRAKKYDEQAQVDEAYDKVIASAKQYPTTDSTVLDYGCGTGVAAFKIASGVKEVHGIDTSENMIALANKRARERDVENVRFSQQTLFDQGFLIQDYDVILAFNILHLLEDARRAVRRASTLLRTGGLLFPIRRALAKPEQCLGRCYLSRNPAVFEEA